MGGTGLRTGLAGPVELGEELYALASALFPINRSITGDGLRETLRLLARHIDLTMHEVASGSEVLDWIVPREWNVREAYVADSSGRRIVDLARSSLHLVGYSIPVRARLDLATLKRHLHSLPDRPDLIPYRTSYYSETWGFCVPHRLVESLAEGEYEVVIDATLADGAMTYGEFVKPGETEAEVLLSAHVCHPALANDNCSGLAVLALLARHLARRPTRYTYRFLLAPGTIGAIAWLALNRETAGRIRHGLTVSNVGDGGGPTYKRSRRGNAEIDRAAALELRHCGLEPARIVDFTPYGSDERQFCSPGFDLPVGSFQRSSWGAFPEYHTSADDLSFIRPEHLERSLRLIVGILDVIERNAAFRNVLPFGEPQLGRRGLYAEADGSPLTAERRLALLWVLNQSDGKASLLDIAERAALPFVVIADAAERLEQAGLLVRPV